MEIGDAHDNPDDHLRQQVERQLDQLRNTTPSGPLSSLEAEAIVEELRIHQVELEMQNEELQRSRIELEKSRDAYLNLYDFAPVGYFNLDRSGVITHCNFAGAALVGYERQYLVDHGLAKFITPHYRTSFYQFIQRLSTTQAKQVCEVEIMTKKGITHYVRLEGTILPEIATGAAVYLLAAIDLTERRQAEQELIESRHFIQQIADSLPNVLYLYDMEERRNVYTNREVADMLGYTPEEIVCMGNDILLSLIHPEDLIRLPQVMQRVSQLQDDETFEHTYRVKHRNGTYRWVTSREVIFKRDASGNCLQILGTLRDVTEQLEAEAEIRAKNRLIEGIVSNLPIIVIRLDEQGNFVTCFGRGLQTIGKKDNQWVGANCMQVFPQVADEVRAVLRGEDRQFLQMVVHENKPFYFQNYYFPDTTHRGAVGFVVDITEQHKAEIALSEANNQLRIEVQERQQAEKAAQLQHEFSENLIENSVDGIFAFDKAWRITVWNRIMERGTKQLKQEVLGKKLTEIFLPYLQQGMDQYLEQVLSGRHVHLDRLSYSYRPGFYEADLIPLIDAQQQVIGGLVIERDITEKTRLEEERLHQRLSQQKLVLSAVLQAQEGERKRIAEALHNGLGQLLYATKLNVEKLSSPLANYDLNSLKISLTSLLDEAIRTTRTISHELVPAILEDFGLEVAIRELIKKIPSGNLAFTVALEGLTQPLAREMEIAIYRIVQELLNNIIRHAQANRVTIEIQRQAHSIHILVRDNGKGFVSNGATPASGIGLKNIRDRVDWMSGELTIESKPGKGTLVQIDIPLPS